jgi:branched-chain amino acid transport system permease protein
LKNRHLIGIVLAVIISPIILSETRVFPTITISGIFVSLVFSLQLIFGFAGQLSLGQAVLFGIGAYTSAYLTTNLNLEPLLAMGVGVCLTVSVALILSFVLRLRGFYFALATLAFALVVEELFNALDPITGGPSGFTNIRPFSIAGLVFSRRNDILYYYLNWGIALLFLFGNFRVLNSRFGRALLAIHEDETAASGLGIHVAGHKIRVWLLASVYASIAGSLYAHYLGFISPPQFGVWLEIFIVMMLIVGGMQILLGPVLGTLLIRLLPEAVAGFEEWSMLVFGLILVIVMMYLPGGLGETSKLIGGWIGRLKNT